MRRREFLRTAVVGAGTTWLGGKFATPLPQQRKLGFALVGLGSLSTNQLAPALQKTRYCRLAAIVTGTPAKAATWKARYGLPDRSIYNYATMADMAGNPDIDVVYVVTPNALHADHTIAAARAGKHVLCEKPMDISTARCQAMIAECRAAGRQLAIGYRCQFEPHHLECIRLAREQVMGKVRRIEAGFGFRIGDPAQWRLRKALAGGGPLMDVGIYALQTARLLTGEEPTSVSATATRTDTRKFSEVEEALRFELQFPGGVVAQCATTYAENGLNQFTAFTDRGSFGMGPAFNYSGNRARRSDGVPLQFGEVDQFAAEMDDFAQRIMTGTQTRVPGEEGLRDVKIMMAAYESARTGRAVTLRT